jgi:SOS response regulatory protein OraA/RecX
LLARNVLFENIEALEYRGAFMIAIKALSKQMLHSKQLVRKLKKHFVEDAVIRNVIETCRQRGYLCDEDVTAFWLRKWERQGKSRLEIYEHGRRLGVPVPNAQIDEEKSLEQLIVKKYPKLLSKDLSYGDRCKIMRALSRRGFSYDLVSSVVLRYIDGDGSVP